jgi:hypothetical protein
MQVLQELLRRFGARFHATIKKKQQYAEALENVEQTQVLWGLRGAA